MIVVKEKTRIHGQTWFETSTKTVSWQKHQKACWYLLTQTE
jgi:hypothetical protein